MDQNEKENAVNQIYEYAANLMVNEKKDAQETKIALIEQGIDEESASIIVANLEQQIKEIKKENANKDLLYGALWALGGLVATVATYAAASDGGTYVAFYGAVIYGGYRFLKGLFSSF